MRKLLILGFLGLSISVFADNAPAPATVTTTASVPAAAVSVPKIGVVDVRTVVQNSPQLKAIDGELMRKFKPRQEAIQDAQTKFKAEQDKYNKDAQTLSSADRTKLEHSIISDRANLQAMITAFQQDLDNEQNASMQKLLSEVANIVNDIAKNEHYDLILQGDSVPYVVDKMNLTNEVLQELSSKG